MKMFIVMITEMFWKTSTVQLLALQFSISFLKQFQILFKSRHVFSNIYVVKNTSIFEKSESFQRKIEKVWDIEKFKFRKLYGKKWQSANIFLCQSF